MGKSYRKPYGTACSTKNSAHDDKKYAARAVRRVQNRALKNAVASGVDWDEFLIPETLECPDNDVWGWAMDGPKHLIMRSRQYNNPFAYRCKFSSPQTDEELYAELLEDQKKEDEFLKYASRK